MQRSDCAFVACWPKPRLNLKMSGTETAVGDKDVAAGRPCEGEPNLSDYHQPGGLAPLT